MVDRIENKEVGRYLRNFVISRLSNCEDFVSVYGKKFASKRLALNLDKVYSNEERDDGGYYSHKDYSITICKSGANGELLKVEDIENDIDLQVVVLHEAIHSILKKTISECKKQGLIIGTGLVEVYNNGTEIGRGLNEGLTNWICKKAGLSPRGYFTFVNIIEQLELGIGSENIMRLGKGGALKTVPEVLGIPIYETIQILSIADNIYAEQEYQNDLNYIAKWLDYTQRESSLSASEQQEYERIQRNVKKLPHYNEIINDKNGYMNYISEIGLEDTVDSKIKYYRSISSKISNGISKECTTIQNIIFERYFSQEFNELKNQEYISDEQYKKYASLYQLMKENRSSKEIATGVSVDFQNDFIKLKMNTISQVNVPSVERETETALAIMPKENFFSKFITKLKRHLFARKDYGIIYKSRQENIGSDINTSLSNDLNNSKKSIFEEQIKVSDFDERLRESDKRKNEIRKKNDLNKERIDEENEKY